MKVDAFLFQVKLQDKIESRNVLNPFAPFRLCVKSFFIFAA